jgi:hypothetical protein
MNPALSTGSQNSWRSWSNLDRGGSVCGDKGELVKKVKDVSI